MASGKYPNKPGTGSTTGTPNTSGTSGGSTTSSTTGTGATGTSGTTGGSSTSGTTGGSGTSGTTGGGSGTSGTTGGGSGTSGTTGGSGTGTGTTSTNGGSSTADRFLVHIPVNAPSTSSNVDRQVDDLFRQVFRGKVPDKPADLIDKLNQVIQAKKVEGRTTPEFSYSPKALTGTTKSIEGQSVAQTSLFERAHAALTDAQKRLAELKPMKTPEDPQNIDALRAVTAATYKRLVNELGEGGGPRNKRALRLFDSLIGDQRDQEDKADQGDQQGGQAKIELRDGSLLKQIEDEFTLTGTASSPEDSANLANFRIMKENLFDIYRGWGTFKKEIEGDFGSRAAKLARTFILIQDDVADLEAVLDAIGYDASDRESDPLPNIKEPEEITVDGLLTWIREFAAEEGPEMLKDGGATGVKATLPTFDELTALTTELETMLNGVFPNTTSVQDSLKSLNARLSEARTLAGNIADRK